MSGLVTPNATQVAAIQNRTFEPKAHYIRGLETLLRKKDPLTHALLMDKISVVEIRNPQSEIAKQAIGHNKEDAKLNGAAYGKADSRSIYAYSFPNDAEAEPTADVYLRLINMAFNRGMFEDQPFMSIAIVHDDLGVIAYSQASVLAQPRMAYWQYGAIGDGEFCKQAFGVDVNFRTTGIREIMHAARLTIVEEALGVPANGTVYETEFRGQSTEFAETGNPYYLWYTSHRLKIGEASGAKGIICEMPDGTHIPLWKQPPLNEGRTVNGRTFADGVPYMLHMGFIPVDLAERNSWGTGEMTKQQALDIVAGLMKNFRLEGFDKYFVSARNAAAFGVRETIDGVALAETAMRRTIEGAARVLLVPLSKTDNFADYAAKHKPLENQLRNTDFEGHAFATMPLAEVSKQTSQIVAEDGARQSAEASK